MLLGRIELPTSPLPRVRSTTELQQPGNARTGRRGLLCAGGGNVKAEAMVETPKDPSREERLAAKLRENLKRRKSQARGQGDAALPKRPPNS